MRDYEGTVLFAASRKRQAPSVPLAQLHAIWNRLTVLLSFNSDSNQFGLREMQL